MKKKYLIKYESPEFLVLADWIDYKLYLEIIWFYGLFKTHKVIEYRIYNTQSTKKHFDHLDNLIKNRLPLI